MPYFSIIARDKPDEQDPFIEKGEFANREASRFGITINNAAGR